MCTDFEHKTPVPDTIARRMPESGRGPPSDAALGGRRGRADCKNLVIAAGDRRPSGPQDVNRLKLGGSRSNGRLPLSRTSA